MSNGMCMCVQGARWLDQSSTNSLTSLTTPNASGLNDLYGRAPGGPFVSLFAKQSSILALMVFAASTLFADGEALATTYTVQNLGTFGGSQGYAVGINYAGQVVGASNTAGDTATHAFLYQNGSMTDLGTLGGTNAYAQAINSLGEVVGSSGNAFLYQNGIMTDLGNLGSGSYGVGINNVGQIIGYSYTTGSSAIHAFIYQNGVMADIGTLGGTSSHAFGINDAGQVVGDSTIAGETATHAFLYQNGGMTDLGTLGGTYARATGINNVGQVVGYSYTTGGGVHAFLYQNGVMADIGTLGGATSYATGINNVGQVVGYSYTTGSSAIHAFIYKNGIMTDLGTGGGSSSYAYGLNDAGQVVGAAVSPGSTIAVMWSPINSIDPKNLGQPDFCPIGDPINQATGNKYQIESDYLGSGPFPLIWQRYYNNDTQVKSAALGANWRGTYDRSISSQSVTATVYRPDGKSFLFQLSNGSWVGDADVPDRLQQTSTGWTYTTADDSVETYDSTGKLLSITSRAGIQQTLTYSDGTTGPNGGYVLDASGFPTTTTLPAGRLIRVIAANSRSLVFGYDAIGRIVKVTDPTSGGHLYTYDANNNLSSITYPDTHKRTYWYNEQTNTSNSNLPNALTGITDENGDRYSSTQYDTQGRATLTEEGPTMTSPAGKYSLTYTTDGSGNPASTLVTDPLNTQRTYAFTTRLGVNKISSLSQPCASCGLGASNQTYDANGNTASADDFDGHRSCYAYDLTRNLETARVEGLSNTTACPGTLASYVPTAGTEQRLIQTQWHPDWRLEVLRAEPKKLTTWVYNGQPDPSAGGAIASCAPAGAVLPSGKPIAVLCKQIEQATTDTTGANGFSAQPTGNPRVTTLTYNALGQVLTVTGPRGQLATNDPDYAPAITTYAYYASTDPSGNWTQGDLASVTDALGHVTQITQYDKNGRPLTVIDPNAITATLSYYPRGWLHTRSVGGKTTTYTYKPWGGIEQITYPDATFVSYGYDDAHRLTSIADSAGRSVSYTLDGMGNRTKDTYVNTDGSSARQFNRVFDALNKLQQEIDGLNDGNQAPRTYTYYANGERQSSTTPKGYGTTGYTTTYAIDALGRTTQMQDPINGSAKPTLMSYDGLDQLIGVTVPNGAATTYDIDGLGNLKQETSSDSGTHQATYDVAGNLKTLRDARNLTLSYTYDALNRVKSISIPATGNQLAGTITYTWDTASGCTHGIGHLCQVSDASGTTTYDYDARGNRLTQTRVENGQTLVTHFAVNDANRPVAVITPTSETVATTLDASGRVDSLSSTQGSTTTPIAQDIRYAATGQISSQTLGQTQITQSFDPAGRPTTSAGPAIVLGDLNGDGIVDVADVALAVRIELGLVVPSSSQLQHGDINGDGAINVADVMHIQRKALGLENF